MRLRRWVARRTLLLAWSAVVLLLVSLVVASTGLDTSARSESEQAGRQQLAATEDLAAAYVADQNYDLVNLVSSWTTHARLTAALAGSARTGAVPPADQVELTRQLDALAATSDGLLHPVVISPAGVVLATGSANLVDLGRDTRGDTWLAPGLDDRQGYVSAVHVTGDSSGRYVVTGLAPVWVTDGLRSETLLGYLAVDHGLSTFQSFVATFAAAHRTELSIIDQDGQVVADSHGLHIGQPLDDAALRQVALTRQDGLTERRDAAGAVQVTASQSVDRQGWTVQAQLPLAQLDRSAEPLQHLLWAGTTALLLLVLALATGWTVMRRRRRVLERERTVALADAARARGFFDAVLTASPDAIMVMDLPTATITYASASATVALGMTPEQVKVMDAAALAAAVHPDDGVRVRRTLLDSRDQADGTVVGSQHRIRNPDGSWRWVSQRLTPFRRSDDGSVCEVLAVLRDVTELVAAEENLQHAALHDSLTALPNRLLLTDRLTSALARTERTGQEIAVLFCDLDGFKRVNDSAGHAAGDAVLRATAERLLKAIRKGDTVARIGGDEFVVLLENHPRAGLPAQRGDGESSARESALSTAARIRRALAEPVAVDGILHVVSSSIGITFAGGADAIGPTPTADDVLRDADTAMYRAKVGGKDRYELFSSGLRSDVVERARVEQLLRAALAEAPSTPTGPVFAVAYQPVLDVTSGRLVGFEALARLRDARGEPVAPDLFIAVAEDTGIIGQLGQVVLERACAQLAAWRRADTRAEGLGMAVNLSARQAQHVELTGLVTTTLERNGLATSDLTLELTESVLLQAGSSTISSLRRLHEMGVRISIDDFGTGYASLRYLATLPVNAVKVDRSFTAGLPGDRVSSTIVRAVAALATDLGLDCVVEGIETEEQRAALPAGVLGQGYLLGRPSEVTDLTRLLHGTDALAGGTPRSS